MRQFADVLREIPGGVYDELTAQLHEVTEAVMRERKVGELTLKIKLSPNGENSVRLSHDIKAKVPEPPRTEAIFFTDAGGNLLRTDPRQGNLELRSVPTGDAEKPKEVNVG